jgi:quinol monooxygenase YgiN
MSHHTPTDRYRLADEPTRRRMLATAATAAVAAWFAPVLRARGTTPMYGLIGKMLATPGSRDALVSILLEGTTAMPGCLSYLVATDPSDPNAIWITEAWDSADSHAASLKLPAVQQAIAKARPMIAGMGERFVTAPVGGHGLVAVP